MTTLSKSKIIFAVMDFGSICADDFRFQYSGRFMYGQTCLGLVGNLNTLIEFIQWIVPEISELAESDMSNVRSDNMGLDMIYYWPDIHVTD